VHGLDRFDVLPLSIATDGKSPQSASIGGGSAPTSSSAAWRGWPSGAGRGRQLRIGELLIAVVRLRPRCVMTTYDRDTQKQDHSVLRRIVSELGGVLALDCAVVRPG